MPAATSSKAPPHQKFTRAVRTNSELHDELSDVSAQRLVQHLLPVWTRDMTADDQKGSDSDAASRTSLEDQYHALNPEFSAAQLISLEPAGEVTPTPGSADYAERPVTPPTPQASHLDGPPADVASSPSWTAVEATMDEISSEKPPAPSSSESLAAAPPKSWVDIMAGTASLCRETQGPP